MIELQWVQCGVCGATVVPGQPHEHAPPPPLRCHVCGSDYPPTGLHFCPGVPPGERSPLEADYS